NVGCGPINTLDQVFADPQVKSRGMVIEMPHAATGAKPVKLIASPIRMSVTEPDYRHAPPVLGQHTEEILSEFLGIDGEEVAALRQRGIV
ncbi:MAG: CoA transferase, partial [Proteobacteria bacterium]|nr:CoA transferase [Pseudomonadota bacterium]